MASTGGDNILVIQARFYDDIADEMLRGAMAALAAANAKHTVVTVPGCLEIPAALTFVLKGDELRPGGRPHYDGYVALGCVIRGETDHYEYVAGECMRGLSYAVRHHGIAIGNGVLTCNTYEQAWERAQVDKGDKGGVAARAALTMMALRRSLMSP
jgi:6,7-dimethyl-8-ribityllumazine synthase